MRDRDLARLYWPVELRRAFDALFDIDDAMGEVVRTTSEPMVGQIRLAWWRERLEEMDQGNDAPAEPRLQAVDRELTSRGISPSVLAGQTYAWERLFDPLPWDDEIAGVIAFRGQIIFTLATLIVAGPGEPIDGGGDIWALVDAARHCSDAQSRSVLLEEARRLKPGLAGTIFPPKLRPLTMLTKLAMRDLARGEPFEPEGTPARAAALIAHRLTGRVG